MWAYDVVSESWEYVSGSQMPNVQANYITPLPGGVIGITLVNGEDGYLYFFGGNGAAGDGTSGICVLLC